MAKPLDADVKRVLNRAVPAISKRARVKIQIEFKRIKNKMLEEFDNHQVTKEIEAGPQASNSSGLLGGYGNLFSFIGFPRGMRPLDRVRMALQATQMEQMSIVRKRLNFETTEPTKEELFDMTKISDFRDEFEGGRSWLDGIETGISGLGFYLYDLDKAPIKGSLSGPAIQLGGGKASGKAFGGGDTGGATGPQRNRFTRAKYIRLILGNFKKSIMALSKRTLS